MLLPTRLEVDFSPGEQSVDYRCSRCGLVMLALVQGGGTGLRVSGVRLSDAGADARVGAAELARLAACPRCGHRSRTALLKVLLVGGMVGLLAGLAAGLVATEQLRAWDPSGDVGVQIGLASFLAVVATTTALKLRSVGRRVRLHRIVA